MISLILKLLPQLAPNSTAAARQDGEMDVDAFVKAFREKKHLYHLRKAKEELMNRELNQ